MKHYFLRMSLFPVLVSLLIGNVSFAKDGFPGRVKYPEVPVVSMQELKLKLNQVVLVDARSKLEYETLRIKGAHNIPVASKTFDEQIRALRATTKKPIVFYCNGRTCMKSYLAVRQAKVAKVNNTFAYDTGMFEWAKTYPKHAALFGRSPIQPKDIISKSKFKTHSLGPDEFVDKVHKLGRKSLVIDIRDKYQRGAAGFFPGKERWASLDDRAKLNSYIKQAKQENRSLFFYDEVGKQVRWLQYALEKEDIKDYYFMASGAKGYYKEMMSEFGIR